MSVSIVRDEELAEQEVKYEKCKLKLQKYPKILCEIAKTAQKGFAVQFQKKFEQLKKAKIVLMEVDFDKIVLLQSRAEQHNSENYTVRIGEFKLHGFLIAIIFPIVVSGLNGMYDLITGYHRIKLFKEIFNMKKSWFIVFRLPDGVELTERDKRDMGIVANPKQPTGSKEFSNLDIAFSVVESAKAGDYFHPQTKKALELKLRPIVKDEIDRFNYKYNAFGFMNLYEKNKLVKEVLVLALDSFDVIAPIDIFSEDDIEKLIKKEQKKVAKNVEIVAPKASTSNWSDPMIRLYLPRYGEKFELVCNFPCHGSRKEYRNLQEKYYRNYVIAIIDTAWIHWMNEFEMGFGGELKDFESIIKYMREKINFKYFSPMHPDHSKKKLVLVEDELDVDAIWETEKSHIKRKYNDV